MLIIDSVSFENDTIQKPLHGKARGKSNGAR